MSVRTAARRFERTSFRSFLVLLVLGSAAGSLRADQRSWWRSWSVRDGFAETYSFAINLTPEGHLLVRHGAVPSMSVFDGYNVSRIPDPRGDTQPDWPATKRVYSAPGGAL